jgi:hydroxymethylpyrimidine pyrophosphatase-like HAD family hydrolase
VRTPRLVASDIDGTLLDPLEQVTPATAAAVGRVLAADVPFVLATGRPPRWVGEPAEAAGLTGYAVCSNGAVVYDIGDDKVLRVRGLPALLLHDAVLGLSGVLPDARFAVERIGESAFGLDGGEFLCEPGYLHPWPGDPAQIAPRDRLLGHEAVKLLVRQPGLGSTAIAEAATAVLGDQVSITFSTGDGLVEIAAADVTKATGLADVADWLGVAAADAVAFGDMPNDVEMLRWAGLGVAMSSGHPDAKAAADELAPPNSEDGVAAVLARWF